MQFSFDHITLFIALMTLVGLRFFLFPHLPSSSSPHLKFSSLSSFSLSSWRTRFSSLPRKCHLAAFSFLTLAFIDPHFLFPYTQNSVSPAALPSIPTEGIALYLLLDQSGSMAQPVEIQGKTKQNIPQSKIEILKNVTQQFILDHPSDLIGLVSFARVPRVLVPLTLDRETLLKQLHLIQVVKNQEEDGTAIGYAIYKTAHLISATRHFADELPKDKRPYTIESAVMIVVTDGFQDPSRLDEGNRLRTIELDDAAAYAKSQNIRLYVINIDPALSSSTYAPQHRLLQKITALTGGQLYLVDTPQDLQEIYHNIAQLEKGKIAAPPKQQQHSPSSYTRFSLYPFLICLGLCALFFALFLEHFILKEIP